MPSLSSSLLLLLLDELLDKHHKPRAAGTAGGIKNGSISNEVCVSIAIRYFAGGRPEGIAIAHGVSHSQVFRPFFGANADPSHSSAAC